MMNVVMDVDALVAGLVWRPIAEYDKDAGEIVLLSDGDHDWEIGYYGKDENLPVGWGGPAEPDHSLAFRHAQDWQMGQLLQFEPTEFAALTEEWQARLMED